MDTPKTVFVLDFDGVVIRRSEFFKQEAWPIVFFLYGERYKPFFKEAEAKYGGGRGGDRFDILRETYRGLGEPENKIPELVASGARAFDDYVQAKIIEAGVTDHDRSVLKKLSERLPIYFNSATPVEAIKQTVENLKLKNVITGVLGRPNSKVENFRFVTEQEGVPPRNVVFLGDSDSDYKVAQEFGCRFVGLANDWNKWGGGEKPFPIITDLAEIGQLLGH